LLEFGPAKSLEEIKRKIEEGVGVYHEKESVFGFGILGFHRLKEIYLGSFKATTLPISKKQSPSPK